MQNKHNNNEWREVRLGDIVTFKYGKTLKEETREGGEVPVYGSGGVVGYHNKALVNQKGLIIGRKGSIGKIYLSKKPFFPIDTVYYIDETNEDLDFLYYFISQIGLEKFNTDAAVPGLNRNLAHNLKIKLPPLETQQRVASILSAYDDKIEANLQRIKDIEAGAQELYKEWFVRFRVNGQDLPTDAETGLPEGWEAMRLGSFGKVVTGKTPSTEVEEYFGGDIPFIKTPDMHGNMFILHTEETLTKKGADTQKSQYLPAGAICVNCIGALSGSVSITTEISHTNQQIHSLIPKNRQDTEFLYFAMSHLKELIHLFGSTGATTTNLNKTKFEGLEMIYSKKVATEFHQKTNAIFSQIQTLQSENAELRTVRDRLLPRLMSGEME